jgi:hypothetical protein
MSSFLSVPEKLPVGVIVTVYAPTHRRLHAELAHQRAILMRAILAAAVGVLHHGGLRPGQRDGTEQGLHH